MPVQLNVIEFSRGPSAPFFCSVFRFFATAGLLALFACNPPPPPPDTLYTGSLLDTLVYAAAPLPDASRLPNAEEIPGSYSLVPFCPKARGQGKQSSCVGWATAYVGLTVLHAQRNGISPDSIAFSPAFLYNQAKVEGCFSGAYIREALEIMTRQGGLPFSQFPYTTAYCDRLPNEAERRAAMAFRPGGYARLSSPKAPLDAELVRRHLAGGYPVIVAMLVGEGFKQHFGKALYQPNAEERAGLRLYEADQPTDALSGHALVVVGYDRAKYGGAFLLQNSWGSRYGVAGRVWVREPDFTAFVREAYALYPMQAPEDTATTNLNLSVGLQLARREEPIPIQQLDRNRFSNAVPLPQGIKFQLVITTNSPVFIYLIDVPFAGSPQVVFPYDSSENGLLKLPGTHRVPPERYLVRTPGPGDQLWVVASPTAVHRDSLQAQLQRNSPERFLLGNQPQKRPDFSAETVIVAQAQLKTGNWLPIELLLTE